MIFDDSRTVGGRCAFAEDIEIMTGSGECHIEQVQIIYDVLQMLVMVVIFIDASFHLFGTEIYRNQRQFVVRSFLRSTPDGVGFSSCQSQYGMMTWSNSSPLLLWMVMSRMPSMPSL